MSDSMTAQEVYDTVKAHLLTQNCRAVNFDMATCAYRGADGTKCAIGCLIRDDEYTPAMEGHGVYELYNMIPKRLAPHMKLLYALQHIHDVFELADWAAALTRLAESFNLTP